MCLSRLFRKLFGGGWWSWGGEDTDSDQPRMPAYLAETGRVMFTYDIVAFPGYRKRFRRSGEWIAERVGRRNQWKKITGHFTHPGMPFYIEENKGKIIVRKGRTDQAARLAWYSTSDSKPGPIYDKTVLTIPKYTKMWLGENDGPSVCRLESGKFTGNSILVHVKGDKYIFIGDHVLEFRAPDRITEFYSSLHGDFVYPLAIGETNSYFFCDDKYLPNSVLPSGQDPYTYFFKNKDSANDIEGKLIEKRAP